MSRATINVTQSWQLISSGAVTITVTKKGAGSLLFNETGTDSNANVTNPSPGDQFGQDEIRDTFVRALGDGYEVLVDGTI